MAHNHFLVVSNASAMQPPPAIPCRPSLDVSIGFAVSQYPDSLLFYVMLLYVMSLSSVTELSWWLFFCNDVARPSQPSYAMNKNCSFVALWLAWCWPSLPKELFSLLPAVSWLTVSSERLHCLWETCLLDPWNLFVSISRSFWWNPGFLARVPKWYWI